MRGPPFASSPDQLVAIPPMYNSPLQLGHPAPQPMGSPTPASGYLTRRIMVTTPRGMTSAGQPFLLTTPQYATGPCSPISQRRPVVQSPPGRSTSPAFQNQAVIYRPPPLSARRAGEPVSHSMVADSTSPPLRFRHNDVVPPQQFYNDQESRWIEKGKSAAKLADTFERRKKRTRPVAAPDLTFASYASSASSRRGPEPPSSSATTTESALSPRRLLCETPATFKGGWPPEDSRKAVPRLRLQQLHEWQNPMDGVLSNYMESRQSQPDALRPQQTPGREVTQPASLVSLMNPGSLFGSATTSSSSGTSASRFGAQPSRSALSSRVHLQTAGGRNQADMAGRPIPHKRVLAAGGGVAGLSTSSSRVLGRSTDVSLLSSSQPLKPELGSTSLFRVGKRDALNRINQVMPLTARPTSGSASRTIGSMSSSSSRMLIHSSLSGQCLTARPATHEKRRYLCNDFMNNMGSSASYDQQPSSVKVVQTKPRLRDPLELETQHPTSSSLSQTSTANDSQSSNKADTDSKIKKRRGSAASNKENRQRASLLLKQPLRSSIKGGQSLAAFETVAMIGQGGYAVVRVVRHKASSQIFALKQVAKVDFTSVPQLRMAFTEVDILCAQEKLSKRHSSATTSRRKPLPPNASEMERRNHITEYVRDNGHRFFPRFFDCWQDEYFIFFLMEFLPGGDLMKHLIDKEIFSEPVAKFYTAQIAVATGFMHDHLLYVHRDIKPDNVLFDVTGHTKLVDFGLSRVLPPRLGTSTRPKFTEAFQSAVGTPDYMAPEVHRPGVPHDRTIDWWSVRHV
eukprot:Blabericola_migrator_1__10456@NODE_591_length_7444_cov_171_716416_g104_i1_p1_GENE_NODE_591_length_7444_cov_171_716416_g104_i1NODE_591_length_7444_cov_171_716416_g104_i1_p1_ORF_typecomplete_len796_score111_33Pkinase/PF00069_25/4e41Pkinase_Tyr/PF07714_17/2_6e18Kdo/PF06293_14/4_5e07Pkinase_fungal/PF17667_1/2_8e06APH/PF01636_23/1_3e04APH/PF01636_23/2e05EcKinase/PF02958_20/0_0025Kinaselike/PF14531_6/0_0041WaaY/PF06176_11/3_5e03WaaY/PF06176_11/0_37_NODE_591_length_7444_cov_171_716416_g104_i126985085